MARVGGFIVSADYSSPAAAERRIDRPGRIAPKRCFAWPTTFSVGKFVIVRYAPIMQIVLSMVSISF
jgi:hypothetical protein